MLGLGVALGAGIRDIDASRQRFLEVLTEWTFKYPCLDAESGRSSTCDRLGSRGITLGILEGGKVKAVGLASTFEFLVEISGVE